MLLITSFCLAAQSKKSEAFKKPPFSKRSVFKPKYKSYPLLAGYLLLKEARGGDPFAQHELALRYLMGRGFPPDTAKAIFWLKKAADKNLTVANFNYGIMLINGIGVNWNPFEAFNRFEIAARAGMPQAEYVYATFFLDNLVVNRNLQKAYDWLQLAAENKVERAEEILNELKQKGITGTGKNVKNEIASLQNNTFVSNEKSELLNGGWQLSFIPFEKDSSANIPQKQLVKIFKKNKKELLKKLGLRDSTTGKLTNIDSILQKAISLGSPNACKLQAKRFEYGIGKPKDTLKAVFYYIRAFRLDEEENAANIFRLIKTQSFFERLEKLAKNRNALAMYVWAELTALDMDFQLTKKQAFQLLLKAAAQGFVPALIDAGIAYYDGKIVAKNLNKASLYWTRASKSGSKEAEIRLAIAEILNKTKKNLKKEINFLKNASLEGSPLALNALGFIFANGVGVKKNLARADYYFRKASSLGSLSAYYSLKSLYDSLRPPERKFKIYSSD